MTNTITIIITNIMTNIMTNFQVHASMAVFWYLDDIVLDWIGQTGPGLGAKVIETRGKVRLFYIIYLYIILL